jgi:hypothetical protein
MPDPLNEARKIVSAWTLAPVGQRTRLAGKAMTKLATLLLSTDPLRINPITGRPNTGDAILDDPDFKAYASRVVGDLVPRIERSGFVMSLVPRGETDVKFAVELGVSIMLGKPFMAVIDQNTPLPEKLAAVLDEIVRVDLEDLDSYRDEIEAAVLRMTERTGGAEGDDPSGELDSWTG